MAVNVAAPRRALGVAPVALRAPFWLGGIVAVSFAVRWLAAAWHATPLYFPDEYVYPSLARNLAETGRPLLRGTQAHFPALLEPILAAPFWLFGDPTVAYRLTQGLHALAASLAAVPVYLLARKLGARQSLALGSAALAVASPDLVYSGFMLADPLAYPLVLGAVYAGVCALSAPTRRSQLAFAALSGFATFARVQYAVLPIAFLAATLVVERGSVVRAASRFRLSLGLFLAPLLAVAALGPQKLLGAYAGVAHVTVSPGAIAHWASSDALLLVYASGFVLVPGALAGLALGLARPRARVESAFAALAVALALGLLLESAFVAGLDSHRFQERYLFSIAALAGPAFALFVERGGGRRTAALVAAGLLLLSARVPLSGFVAAHGKDDSPTLFAVRELERFGGTANASLAVAAVAALCCLAALAAAFRPRRYAGLAVLVAIAATGALSAGAVAFDRFATGTARSSFLPADLQWIDHARLGSVALVQTPLAHRSLSFEQLVWNRSIDEVVLLGHGAEKIDTFDTKRAFVRPDGRLDVDGRAFRKPMLVQTFGSALSLTDANLVARHAGLELWRPIGTPRLAWLASGLYWDGWLSRAGSIQIWPDASGRVAGTLALELSLPEGSRPTPIRFRARGLDLRLTLHSGEHRPVSFQVVSPGPWTLRYSSDRPSFLDDLRGVSVRTSRPVFERAGGPSASGRLA